MEVRLASEVFRRPIAMKAPPQAHTFSSCHAHLHAVPFFYPPRLRGGGGGGGAAAAASDLQLSLSNSRIYSSRSFLVSQKLSTSISNEKTCKPPCSSSSSSNDIDRPKDPAAFLDENGAIEDMDGYLNYLSLEYDSVWDTKPSWCQPWTIISSGVLIITGSWLILHSAIVTSVVLSLTCAWWYIFLVSYPKAYSEMIADRRSRVTSGEEDTFGLGTLEARNEGGDGRSNSK